MKLRAICCSMLFLATAGCASPDFGMGPKAAQQVDMSAYFAERLAAGRAHLDAGRPTKAIEAFRQASYGPAVAPDALNGMAVAYSTLGRDDVARNLFARAIELDPSDQRYLRNLAKADERIMLAQQPPALAGSSDDAPADAATAAFAALPKDSPPAARPVRTARPREVLIQTNRSGQARETRVAEQKLQGAIITVPLQVTPLKRQAYSPSRRALVVPAKPREIFLQTTRPDRAPATRIAAQRLPRAIVTVPLQATPRKGRTSFPIQVALAPPAKAGVSPQRSASSAPAQFRFSPSDQ